jgi:predicted transcriptional regulator of viral defense system
MLNEIQTRLFYEPDCASRLSATARLFLVSLYPNRTLTINEVAAFTGSTPFFIQQLGGRLTKQGRITRTRTGNQVHYSLPSTMTQAIA